MEYVSIKEFKKLEQKVNQLIQQHTLDAKMTKKEKKLVKEAKKDIKKKTNFVSIKDL